MAFINFINVSGGGGGDASAITQDFTSTIERTVSSLTLPSGTTTIGQNAFASCSALTEVVIPAGVTSIEANAFAENRSLQTITFEGTTPPTVAADAFSQLPENVEINVPEGAEDAYSAITEEIEDSTAFIIEYTDFSGNTLVWYSKNSGVTYNDASNAQPERPEGGWAKIEIKNIKYVDDNAFLYEDAVEYVFDDAVSWIGCTPIRGNVYSNIPTKITYKSTSYDHFDARIVEMATNVSSVTFYCPTAPSIIDDGYINSSHTANYGELFIPEGAKNYGAWKDFYCGEDWVVKDLSGNTMQAKVEYTYENDQGNVVSGDCYYRSEIATKAFFMDTSIQTANIDAAFVQTQSFYGCTALTEVHFSQKTQTVMNSAFQGCSSLSSITCYATTAPGLTNNYVFFGLATGGTLNIPAGSDYSRWLAKLPSGWTINEMGGGGSGTFDLVNNCANYGSGKTDILDFYIPLDSSATPTLDIYFGSSVGADGLATELRGNDGSITFDYIPNQDDALKSGEFIYDITQHSWLYSDSSVYENYPDANAEADLQTLGLFTWQEEEVNGETYLLISMNSGECYATMADLIEWGLYDEEIGEGPDVVDANNEIYTYYQ